MPQFIASVHKSSKQFGFSFAYDAPNLWNELPDDIHSAGGGCVCVCVCV